MSQATFTPGTLVQARGRKWLVLAGSDTETLRLRPLSGSEEDQALIYVPLEPEKPKEDVFPLPTLDQRGGQDGALLLRDALQLSLRRGAGPFRSFGQIAVAPRAYQLVPLLMALKQQTVRLLIADDVGIGKTIEASLIARELLDRGDVERFAVLCPPHLVEQWVRELDRLFNLRAVAVTAGTAARLERDIHQGSSIFQVHPLTVVSLDYIKAERRRDDFLRACPELVIVDEAHTCTATGAGRHQRYELLKGLTEGSKRHLVMLTATPHSGDDDAFYRLLGLLDPKFLALQGPATPERDALREQLASHFVQRRRPDISEWKEGNLFPRRETRELTYRLTGAWERFFEAVLDYCTGEGKRRLDFITTLALLRCASSSSRAALRALKTRAGLEDAEADSLFDGSAEALPGDDQEPPAGADDPALKKLMEEAEMLSDKGGDPKLEELAKHLKELLDESFSPVVFCRYIATAHYLEEQLAKRFKGVTVAAVTGELASEEREERVAALGDAEKRLLIATDCLSEGINLQEHFDSVVHYDLSWNPTRHEQREGRVDRFGQDRKVVRTTLLYGANNPVDGAVLEVILRKAERIRLELGVPVPLPDEGHTLTQALVKAVLLKGEKQRQLDFGSTAEAKAIDQSWKDAAEKTKANRTVFAQRRLKPDEVLPEWEKTLAALGGSDDVKRFVDRALHRLGSGLEPLPRGGFKAALESLPADVKERLENEELRGAPRVAFTQPHPPRCKPVHRSHPLVSVLAESLLERTLAGTDMVLGRVGCWVSTEVTEQTTVVLLRLRHQLSTQRGGSMLLVEESGALAWSGERLLEGQPALELLGRAAAEDAKEHVAKRVLSSALELLPGRKAELEAYAQRRADALLADHRRVRAAADARGSWSVRPVLPVDVIGLYVLQPKVS